MAGQAEKELRCGRVFLLRKYTGKRKIINKALPVIVGQIGLSTPPENKKPV
jgi:hypothetical protein